ncbi:MAG: hypothetical protein AAF846_04935 [Chloroflexota bacterium]
MQYRFHFIVMIVLFALGYGLFSAQPQPSQAQPRITNTTIPVVIPTTAPTEPPQSNNQVVEASPSPTFTPTQPLPNARLVSIAAPGTAIIRDFPESGANIGVLQDGIEYQVLGQYFSWYQIQVNTAPNGVAWAYIEDVRVSGNFDEIPFINPESQPAQLSAQDIATQTAQALFQTPGFAETATAESRLLEVPQETPTGNSPDNRLPTFTPPADLVPLRPTTLPNAQPTPILDNQLVKTTIESIAEGNIPPILPVVGLAIVGVLGLLLASIRN